MGFGYPPNLLADGSVLPVDVTSFVGRRAELAEVKRLLATYRLVTLTGVGGVGKTRIALRATSELRRRFTDGVAWVELADLRDPALLAQTVEDRFLISERVGRDPLAILVNHLRFRSMLLVLDNAEHVLDDCARLVDELVRAAPGLRVLVTSRQALNVPGERLLAVAPLLVPSQEQSHEPGAGVVYPSMALFQDRAEASMAGFAITPANQAAVADICRKLEGIPLAIELATVKLRVLSVEQLADRLDARLEMLSPRGRSAPSRHQTLQATIDWSFELCTPNERLLWARTSVFAGGFGVEAAEACCSDDELSRSEILETIAGLVDKSILIRSEIEGRARFRLLEPLREHGLAGLERRGDLKDAQDRHLAWCGELVNEACMQWFGPAQERWCVTMQIEKANVRAAAEHCLRQPDKVEDALRLLGEPWFLWVALFLDEGRHWLDKALAVSKDHTPARAKALATAGYVAALQGDGEAAGKFLAESRSIADAIDDSATLAYATHVLGLSVMFHDPERAVTLFQQALTLYGAVDDVYDDFVVALRIQFGLALLFRGDLETSAEQFALCRELCTVTGERWLLSYVLYGEAFISMLRGDLDTGLVLAREAVVIKRFFGDVLGLALSLDLLAWINAEAENAVDAAVLLGAASRVWDSFGARLFGSEHWLAQRQHAVDGCRQLLGPTRYTSAFDRGEAMSREAALAFALGESADAVKVEEPAAAGLTPREREIAELVADGLSNKAISQRLVIAQRTAECHVENILTKFGFHSRSQIAAWVAGHRSLI